MDFDAMDQQIPDAQSRVGFNPASRIPYITFMRGAFVVFSSCPICFEGKADSREHVPPRELGGKVLTKTCRRCNNVFGARYENDLADWFHERARIRLTWKSGDERAGGKALVRRGNDGRPLISMIRPAGQELTDRLAEPGTVLIPILPSERRVRVALLKSAFLAASVIVREVVATPAAGRARELLLDARDRPDASRWVNEEILDDLKFSQSYTRPNGFVTFGLSRHADDKVNLSIGLAGTVYVKFPFGDNYTLIALDESGQRVEISLAAAYDSMWHQLSTAAERLEQSS